MIIVSTINSLVIALGISIILNIIEFRKIEKGKLFCIFFGVFIIFNNQSGSINIMYSNQLLSVILIGILEYLDNGNFLKGIINGGIALILCTIASSLINTFIYGDKWVYNSYVQIFLTIIIVIAAIQLAFFFRKIYVVLKQYNINQVSWKVISMILILIIGGLSAYIAIIPREVISEEGKFTIYHYGGTFSIYLIILIILIYVLGGKLKSEIIYKQKLKEAENLKEYTNSLEEMYEDLRRFRHDYINIISSIVGYVDDEDIIGLKSHIYKNIIPLEQNINKNNTKIHLLKNIKLSELKGLVSSKLIRAQELNINVTVDIIEEIESINIDAVTLCRIIGILIDNGIEECENIENSYITFGIIKNPSSIDFIVANSCRENIEPIYILNSNGFSTKGNDRGLGLAIVEELIKDNSNLILDTIVENRTFTQILTVEGLDYEHLCL